MLKHRLITGPLLIALILAIFALDDWMDTRPLGELGRQIFRGREYPPRGMILFLFCILIVMPLAGIELARIVRANSIMVRTWLICFAAMFGLALSYCIPEKTNGATVTTAVGIVGTGLIVMFIASLITFSQNRNTQGVLAAAGAVMLSMVYLGLMTGFFLALRRWHTAWLIIGIVLTTKAMDTGAYFSGRAFGKHKLIPWLSPGKTWEGLFGGLMFAALVGSLLAWASASLAHEADHVPIWLGAVCGVVFGVVGQAGDLTVSLFKRGAGMKDSSTLLPGLGGALDVLDSPLMVAPVAFWLLR